MPLLFTMIASGFNVSGDIDLRQFRLAGIQVPLINSGDLAFRGSFDPTSALFTRIANSSGDLRIPVQAGSRSIAAPREVAPFGYLRLETILGGPNSFQTDTRTLALMTWPRT
jgi:hypothetical protein